MRARTLFTAGIVTLLAAMGPAAAQDHNMLVCALVGVGGGINGDLDDGFDEPSFEVGFGFYTGPRQLVFVRAGQIGLAGDLVESADLSFLTFSGEYRFFEGWYDSGIYAGLGVYQVEGAGETVSFDETSFGVVLGVTGEFDLSPGWSILVDISGHWTDLEHVDAVVNAAAGVAWRF